MKDFRQRGHDAEDRAAQFILQLGYTLITRRWQRRGVEIDIVALDQNTVVFFEIKLRPTTDLAIQSITPQKRERLLRAAQEYILIHNLTGKPVRFDVILASPEGLTHIPNAF